MVFLIGTKTDGASMTITNIGSLFYNTGFTGTNIPSQFWHVTPRFIKPDGTVITGNASGWRFSNGQGVNTYGYNTTSKFSVDDGVWGIEFGANIDGNSPGPNFTGGSKFIWYN